MKGTADMWNFKVTLWMVYLLLIFCGPSYSCGSAEYEVNGECCPMCSSGTRVYRHCTEYTSTSCAPCSPKSFTEEPNGLTNCFPCKVCDPVRLGLKTDRVCTLFSDTVCGPLDQHYCSKADNKGCIFAQKRTTCSPGQFIIHNGTASTDTECGDCPDKTFSDKPSATYCKPHTDCQSLGLQEITAGTNTSDSECGPRNLNVSMIVVPVILSFVVLSLILIPTSIYRRRKQNKATVRTQRERKYDRADEGLQGGLEIIPACERDAGLHPGQDTNPLQDTHNIPSRTYSNVRFSLICLPLNCQRKQKDPEEACRDLERTHKYIPHRKAFTGFRKHDQLNMINQEGTAFRIGDGNGQLPLRDRVL